MNHAKAIAGAAVIATVFGLGAFAFFGAGQNQNPQPASPRPSLPKIALKEIEEKLSLILVGDIMLDREVYRQTLKAGDFAYPYKNIDSFLQTADLRAANLEGPITGNKSVALGKTRTTFTFAPPAAPELARRFDVVSLANNHTRDFGADGYKQTLRYLQTNKINYFGDYFNSENLSKIIEKNGFKIGFVGWHGLADEGLAQILEEIKKLKPRVDFLIVYPHWGAEYLTDIQPALQPIGRGFIEAGADLVVGTHPHVVEPMEIYKGKLIFYSLGNFIFDQYWSEETGIGLAVKLTLRRQTGKIQQYFELAPVQIPGTSQTELANASIKEKILTRLGQDIPQPELKEKIRQGKFVLKNGESF